MLEGNDLVALHATVEREAQPYFNRVEELSDRVMETADPNEPRAWHLPSMTYFIESAISATTNNDETRFWLACNLLAAAVLTLAEQKRETP